MDWQDLPGGQPPTRRKGDWASLPGPAKLIFVMFIYLLTLLLIWVGRYALGIT